MSSFLRQAALAVVLALIVLLGVQTYRVRRAQRAAGAAALVADTTRAHFDTSHAAAVSPRDSARIFGDSLHAVQRLVVQVQQARDAIDEALRLQRIALAKLTAQVEQLNTKVTGATPIVESANGTRTQHFDVRSEPYTVAADVILPRPPATGDMAVRVTLDPATVDLRLGCAKANDAGIRSATATATGPRWLALSLGRVEQSPELCASPALAAATTGRWAGLRRWLPHPSVGYGITAQDSSGALVFRRGWQAGVHIDLWRP